METWEVVRLFHGRFIFAKCCLQVQNALNFTLFLRSYNLGVVRSSYPPWGQFFPRVAPLERKHRSLATLKSHVQKIAARQSTNISCTLVVLSPGIILASNIDIILASDPGDIISSSWTKADPHHKWPSLKGSLGCLYSEVSFHYIKLLLISTSNQNRRFISILLQYYPALLLHLGDNILRTCLQRAGPEHIHIILIWILSPSRYIASNISSPIWWISYSKPWFIT